MHEGNFQEFVLCISYFAYIILDEFDEYVLGALTK